MKLLIIISRNTTSTFQFWIDGNFSFDGTRQSWNFTVFVLHLGLCFYFCSFHATFTRFFDFQFSWKHVDFNFSFRSLGVPFNLSVWVVLSKESTEEPRSVTDKNMKKTQTSIHPNKNLIELKNFELRKLTCLATVHK